MDLWFGLIRIMSLRLIQQSEDKKSLLTNVHCRHREEEEEVHKIK